MRGKERCVARASIRSWSWGKVDRDGEAVLPSLELLIRNECALKNNSVVLARVREIQEMRACWRRRRGSTVVARGTGLDTFFWRVSLPF